MTPAQASVVIGCSPQQVRSLIRTGKIKARRKPIHNRYGCVVGHAYTVTPAEAERYANTPQSRGYPRGKPRK